MKKDSENENENNNNLFFFKVPRTRMLKHSNSQSKNRLDKTDISMTDVTDNPGFR